MLAALNQGEQPNGELADTSLEQQPEATIDSIDEVVAEQIDAVNEVNEILEQRDVAASKDNSHGSAKSSETRSAGQSSEALEKVLNNGMEFLSGLLQMATGNAMGLENKKVEIDKQTGEVVMRLKLPKL